MIKQIVHIEEIERNGFKQQFQIKLPSNAKKILAIKITANPFDRTWEGKFESEIGWLWLRLPEKRDVFYAHKISTYKDNYNLGLPSINELNSFSNSQFQLHGKKEQFQSVTAQLNTNIIEGYYIDRIYSQKRKYQLRIYLKLEL
ncbi:MAG: hypothetical protein N4A35_17665 [Flavobacteriales bacterium]|jgi:hypothetical protein|nr:hypothetical protein [Flavobacteriales bacterium]